jgi:DNA adenine methylase
VRSTNAKDDAEDRGDDVVDDFRYPGGKGVSGVYHTLLRLQPPHQLYIEPFLGKSKMMRTKRPAITSIGIDVDANVTKWWKRQLRREDVPGLSVWHGDALELLPNAIAMGGAARDQTLIYADPEYLETVTTRARYPHRFGSEAKHKRLLTMLVQLADRGCMVMVSGYYSTLYGAMLRGWYQHGYEARLHRGVREEIVWCSFPPAAGDSRRAVRWCRLPGTLAAEKARASLASASRDHAAAGATAHSGNHRGPQRRRRRCSSS